MESERSPDPGLMVVGESDGFMSAEVTAGKPEGLRLRAEEPCLGCSQRLLWRSGKWDVFVVGGCESGVRRLRNR